MTTSKRRRESAWKSRKEQSQHPRAEQPSSAQKPEHSGPDSHH